MTSITLLQVGLSSPKLCAQSLGVLLEMSAVALAALELLFKALLILSSSPQPVLGIELLLRRRLWRRIRIAPSRQKGRELLLDGSLHGLCKGRRHSAHGGHCLNRGVQRLLNILLVL